MTSQLWIRLAGASALAGLSAMTVHAEGPPLAVELGQTGDMFTQERVTVRVSAPAAEPAAAFVRGCAGHVAAESAGAAFELGAPWDNLYFAADADGLVAMVLGTPDGLFRCALHGDDGAVLAEIADPQMGRYTAWLASESDQGRIEGRLSVSNMPLTAISLRGFDLARLEPPRGGHHMLEPSAYDTHQVLATGPVVSRDPADQVTDDWCVGYTGLDAADAVLTLGAPEEILSLYAMSDTDLTIAVRTPDGRWLCNDDTFDVHPAVTLQPAAAGEYHVFVGAFSQGAQGQYELFAAAGYPRWSDSQPALDAPPRAGTFEIDTARPGERHELAIMPVVAMDRAELLGGTYCAGFVGIDAPDMILSLDSPAPELSVYATSETDLVIVVRAPDGEWLCNDDSFGTHPAVTFAPAAPGDYHVFVGAFAEGATGEYTAFATLGAPLWADESVLDHTAPAAAGRITFGPTTELDPRMILPITTDGSDAFGLGEGCVGFIDTSRPDAVITIDGPLPQFMAYAVSDADGTMLVRTPSGRILCNDDFEGLNPALVITSPEEGDYAVWVGSYGGIGGMATLGVTVDNPLWTMDREH